MDEFLEPLERGAQRVSAAGDVTDVVSSGRVGHRDEREAGLLIFNGDGGARDRGAARVGDSSRHTAVQHL